LFYNYGNFIINDQLRQKNKKIGKKGQNKSKRHTTHHQLLLLFVSGEKAEVTIAILQLLLAKAVTCKHKEFVEFISEETSPK